MPQIDNLFFSIGCLAAASGVVAFGYWEMRTGKVGGESTWGFALPPFLAAVYLIGSEEFPTPAFAWGAVLVLCGIAAVTLRWLWRTAKQDDRKQIDS